MKVMIVDDDSTTLSVLKAMLERRGHEVIERSTAIGTTLAILRERPDVVVLDVRMPGLSGDKLASLIGNESQTHPVVILHSSMPMNELRALARSSGADGFVQKSGTAAMAELNDVMVAALRNSARKPS